MQKPFPQVSFVLLGIQDFVLLHQKAACFLILFSHSTTQREVVAYSSFSIIIQNNECTFKSHREPYCVTVEPQQCVRKPFISVEGVDKPL